jgi:hypothetical protein
MNPVKNLWNDTPSEVLNHYQQLVHKVLQVNSRCQVLLSDLLPRAQDFYPGKMKSEDFLYLVNRKAAFINNKVSIIVQSNSRLSYIGHTSFVIGGKLQRQLLCKDGLHLSRSGAATVVRDLEGEIHHLLRCRPLRTLRTTTHRDPYSVNYQTSETTTIEHPTPYLDALKSSIKPTTTQPTTEVTKPVPDQPNDFPSLPTREVSIWDPRPTVSSILNRVSHSVLTSPPVRSRVSQSVLTGIVSSFNQNLRLEESK